MFEEWIARPDLPLRIARADVCLGVFGSTGQSLRTIHNKIYEALACARPVVTGQSPTVAEVITHGRHAYLVGRDDPTALAGAILTLRDDPELRQRLAENGYVLFQQRFTHKAVGATMAQYLKYVLASARSAEGRMIQASVIVPNLHSPIVGQTIQSLRCQDATLLREIIVVGQDRHHQIQEDALVRFLVTPQPVNPAVARNIGIRAARGDVLVFVDADCIAAPDWLARLAEHYADPQTTVVGGSVDFASDNYWTFSDNLATFHEYLPCTRRGTRAMLPSLNLSVRAAILDEVGGLRRALPLRRGRRCRLHHAAASARPSSPVRAASRRDALSAAAQCRRAADPCLPLWTLFRAGGPALPGCARRAEALTEVVGHVVGCPPAGG